jgi:molybdopterin-guanine dinucleotide biosynthesis protein A
MQPLPVHGFVLAGGRSSRMAVDKATLLFCGRPMVEIAVEKLRSFCAEVSIAGSREDLAAFAPVVHETRLESGPAAGVEAGLRAAKHDWVMFLPVDVPLVPAELLRRWAEDVLHQGSRGLQASNLFVEVNQPAFCMLRRECLAGFSDGLESGERRLSLLLQKSGHHQSYGPDIANSSWFMNINTPQDMADAEAWARHPTNQ